MADSSISKKTSREKFFYDLCQHSPEVTENLLFQSNEEFQELAIVECVSLRDSINHRFFCLEFSFNSQNTRRIFNEKSSTKSFRISFTSTNNRECLSSTPSFENFPSVVVWIFSWIMVFRILVMPTNGCSNREKNSPTKKFEEIFVLSNLSFSYRLLDESISKDRNTLFWIRFDAFVRQMISNSSSEEIYLM